MVAAGLGGIDDHRAGVHARRTAAIQNRGVRPAAGPAGWGIPPYVRPEGRGRPAWPGACHGV